MHAVQTEEVTYAPKAHIPERGVGLHESNEGALTTDASQIQAEWQLEAIEE